MKNKWNFRITNDWDFVINTNIPLINIELLSFHWECHARWITVLGFSFVWELIARERI